MHKTEIRRAIEAGLWDREPDFRPANLVLVDRPDRLLWSGSSNSPYANKVVRVNLPPDRAEAAVNEIIAFFTGRRKPFTWWVGPSSRPLSLPDALTRAGPEGLRI